MAEGEVRPTELMKSLAWLSMLLARHHGSQTVILIDEYDTPVNGPLVSHRAAPFPGGP